MAVRADAEHTRVARHGRHCAAAILPHRQPRGRGTGRWAPRPGAQRGSFRPGRQPPGTGAMKVPRPVFVGGVTVFAGGLMAAYAYVRLHAPLPKGCGARSFDSLADTYDRDIGWDETLMGIKFLRWWYVGHVKVGAAYLEDVFSQLSCEPFARLEALQQKSNQNAIKIHIKS